MAEKLKYHGRVVKLESALRTGGWNWAYSIEGGRRIANPGTPLPSRNMALKEATIAAFHEIDINTDDPAPEPEGGYQASA